MALTGEDLISLHWYENAWDLHRGLRKNAFPAMDYSLGILFGFILTTIVLYVLPFFGLFMASGWVLGLLIFSIVFPHLFFMGALVALGEKWYLAVLLAPAAIFLCTAHIRSTWVCLASGSVTWRESTYSLKQLKEFRRRSKSKNL